MLKLTYKALLNYKFIKYIKFLRETKKTFINLNLIINFFDNKLIKC